MTKDFRIMRQRGPNPRVRRNGLAYQKQPLRSALSAFHKFPRVDEMALFNLADMKLMVVSVADQIKGATGGQVWSDGVVMVHADSHAVHQEVGHFSVQ